ncbi:MAG: SDR family oxidoreductase [Bacteroidia bacterium]|nr:SDR family oxidoreductase [Bacteroidia bacterium]
MPVLVVTGVSRGIGYAIARRFAGVYTIVGCSRTSANIDRIRRRHPDWDVGQYDLGQKAQAVAFAAHVLERYAEVDVLVNNAGRFQPGSLLEESDEVYEEMLASNLHSAYYVTKAFLPRFIAQRSGLIVNMASVASLGAYPNGSSYSIAKAALLSFSRNLREQLKVHQVRVTTFLLGATLTDSWEGAPYPPDRFISPETVAELVWTLAHLPPQAVVEELLLRPMLGDI